MKLKDRVAVITGGARGIGKAIGSAFVREGAKVCLVDVDAGPLEALKEEFVRGGGVAFSVLCDITKYSEVIGMMTRAKETLGRIDILINNAGVFPHVGIILLQPLYRIAKTLIHDRWDKVLMQ